MDTSRRSLQIGDAVRLKSGSPSLLVVDREHERVTVAGKHVDEFTAPDACFTLDPIPDETEL